MELARCEYIERPHNVIARRQQWHRQDPYRPRSRSGCVSEGTVPWASPPPPALVQRADRGQGRTASAQPAEEGSHGLKLLIIDELGFVPTVQDWRRAALRGVQPALRAWIGPGDLQPEPFVEWTEVFGSETADRSSPRPPHPPEFDILEMNGDSYRLKHSKTGRHHALSQRYLTDA